MMTEAAFCGVDIGTTHIKVVLVGTDGDLVAVERAPTPVTSDGIGPCHDPEEIRALAEDLVVRAQQRASQATIIRSIGVTSVGEEGVPLDAHGTLLYPAIAWYDRRPSHREESWQRQHSAADRRAVSGLHADLGFTVYKWLWLHSERPEVWRDCARWLGLGDYLVWRWTGVAAMSASHASRTCLYDLWRRRWHDEWAAEVLAHGVDTLPPVVHAGDVVGLLRTGAIDGLVAESGAPVVATGLDHVVGGFAAGVRDPGQLLDSLGTAEAIVAPVPPSSVEAGWSDSRADFGAGLRARAVIGLAALGSGSFLAALRTELGAGTDGAAADLERAAAAVPPGADGVRFIPPRVRSGGTGAYAAGSDPGPAVRYRAALEGWSMAAAHAIEAIEPAAPTQRRDIVTIGGGIRSRLWGEIKADVLGFPVTVVHTPELVGIGAALLAAEATGPDHPLVGWRAPARDVEIITPNPHAVEKYRAIRDEFRDVASTVYPGEAAPYFP